MAKTYTPAELDEIERRINVQFVHDAVSDAATFREGLRHYALRQILYYAAEVKKESGRRKRGKMRYEHK